MKVSRENLSGADTKLPTGKFQEQWVTWETKAVQETKHGVGESKVTGQGVDHGSENIPTLQFPTSAWNVEGFSLFIFKVFQDRVHVCSPGSLGTRSIHQAGLKLT